MGVEVLHGAGPPAPGDRWASAHLQSTMGRTVTFGPRLRPMALINLSLILLNSIKMIKRLRKCLKAPGKVENRLYNS